MNRPLMHFALTTTLGAATAGLAGCEPQQPITASVVQFVPPVSVTVKPTRETVVKPDDVFLTPTPGDAGDHPSVLAAGAAAETVRQSLAVVHKRLADLKTAYETKVQTQGDLRQIAQRMQPLITAAQADCDAILRAARNLKFEYPFARQGYEATAELYRTRGRKFRDAELAAVELATAAEFERLAEDVPRRIRLTSDFVEQLIATQEFLAEADRCLRDTAAALAILSAGPDTPRVSPQGSAFRRRLEEFITVVEEFQRKLLTPPLPKPPRTGPETTGKPNGGDAPPPPAPKTTDQEKPPPAPVPVQPQALAKPVAAMVSTQTVRPIAPAQFLQAGVTLQGRTVHAGIVTPAILRVRERAGDEIAGDIAFATINGPGARRFRGRVHAGGEIVLRGDRVQGDILPSPCFYQGHAHTATIEGSWTCGNVAGSFWFSAAQPPPSYRDSQVQPTQQGTQGPDGFHFTRITANTRTGRRFVPKAKVTP